MTDEERGLLLTVGRILRARLPEMAPAYQDDDLTALNEALAPFGPEPGAENHEAPVPPIIHKGDNIVALRQAGQKQRE